MKKLKLEGKAMLSKDQMKAVTGGYGTCPAPEGDCFCDTLGNGQNFVYIGCYTSSQCIEQCNMSFPGW